MAQARFLFDQVIGENPDMVKYISEQSDIVHSPDFEYGIVKLQKTENSEMFGTDLEKRAVKCLGKAIVPADVETEKKGTSSLAERAMKRTRMEIEVEYQVSHCTYIKYGRKAFQPSPTNHD